jgi:hypothetical protein
MLALCLALVAGCADPPPGTGSAPHGDAGPSHGTVTLTDADINAWLAAIGGYRAGVWDQSAVGEACYLITQAQGRADLAHPDGQWTLDAGAGGDPPPGQPAGSECLVRAPSQSFGLGPPANGDVGGVLMIQQGWQPPKELSYGPYLQVPIPGTSWSLIYLAWHQRQPSVHEVAWVLRDLAANWSQPPPVRPPSAYLAR